jgi:dihydrofolate reductase
MRKLKLEVQLSLDGFASDIKGKTNWMIWDWQPEWNWDKELRTFHTELQTTSDTILLGKKMAVTGFFEHWQQVAEDAKDPQHKFANAINHMKKYVFSKKLSESRWENTEIINGNLNKEVNKLKKQEGKDIIVYGGTSFVSSLIEEELIDEYNLIINPTIIGKGKPIFKKVSANKNLTLTHSKAYACGVVVLRYTK